MTGLIINAGSGAIGDSGEGWTNTYRGARNNAEAWLEQMLQDGFADIELLPHGMETDGRWLFTFRHTVTGVEVTLETHGIDDIDAYCKRFVFSPKVYWNGSSSGEPTLQDFAADGFRMVKTYVPDGEE